MIYPKTSVEQLHTINELSPKKIPKLCLAGIKLTNKKINRGPQITGTLLTDVFVLNSWVRLVR